MKRSLLVLAIIGMAGMANAQCTPNPIYQDSVFGAWPDTIINFAPAQMGVFYSDTLNILIPTDAGAISPIGAGSTIDSVAVMMVTGLPNGINYSCNSHTAAPCTYLPTVVGCALMEGTPTQIGTNDITIDVLVYATTFLGPATIPYQFPGYRIDVGVVGVAESNDMFTEVRNVPNPFQQTTSIQFNSKTRSDVDLKVYDLLGGEQFSQKIDARQGANNFEFDGSLLESGIYLYELRSGSTLFTGRMVLYR